MKFLLPLIIAVASAAVFAQGPDVLATSSARPFTADDLSPEAKQLYEVRDTAMADLRKQLLTSMIYDRLLETEAAAKGVTAGTLTERAKAAAAAPTESQIKAVYDANRSSFGDSPLEKVRKPIVEYLRRDGENAVLIKYLESLAAKYRRTIGKDINAAGLKPADVVATVNGKQITAGAFEARYKLVLNSETLDQFDQIAASLKGAIYAELLRREAAARKIDTVDLYASEVTNKLRDFSDEERAAAEGAFRKGLFDKYAVNVLLKSPEPLKQAISADDDPATGPANAPVTVVMFSDFQCPSCSAAHPVLKNVLAEYPGKIRFVVRDYPLPTLHKNAFRAALAANAANAQGKFFEYTEILYAHQDALDDASLAKYAAEIGLNVKQFRLDLNLEKTSAEVKKDMADGNTYGITGTPTIFVNGIAVRNFSAQGFRDAIENALKP
jgi:protein-disulfide isomerase